MMVRVAAVGTSSTGKSALLNALFGTAFQVDARGGSTIRQTRVSLSFEGAELEVIDTPPLDKHPVPVHADVFLLVCDKDLVEAEYDTALRLSRAGRPLLIAINKSDTYDERQRSVLLDHVRERLRAIVPAHRIVICAADPVRVVDQVRADGSVVERVAAAPPQIDQVLAGLRELIEEAKASLRVQAREYTREAMHRVRSAASTGWKILRDR